MTEQRDHTRAVSVTALLAVGLVAALIFGVLVLAGGDWLPGTIIVVAAVAGLAREVSALLRPHGEPRPPRAAG